MKKNAVILALSVILIISAYFAGYNNGLKKGADTPPRPVHTGGNPYEYKNYIREDGRKSGRDEVLVIPELRLIPKETTEGAIKYRQYFFSAIIYLVRVLRKRENFSPDEVIGASGSIESEFQVNEKVVDLMKIKKGQSVADVGCGTGFYLKTFYDLVGKNGAVYAVDTDPNSITFIKWARDLRKAAGDAVYDFIPIISRYDDVMLPEKSVDWIFMSDVHIYTYKGDADSGIRRVLEGFTRSMTKALKPGGKILILEGTRRVYPRHESASRPSVKVMAERVREFSDNSLKLIDNRMIGNKLIMIFEKIK